MADITQTAANVGLSGTGVQISSVQVGETITQGEPLYLKAADSKYWRADADDSAQAAALGIALTPAAADGYVVLATSGPVDLGATLTVGEVYVVSTVVGNIAPNSDLATGDYVTILGVATATDTLQLDINASGALTP